MKTVMMNVMMVVMVEGGDREMLLGMLLGSYDVECNAYALRR